MGGNDEDGETLQDDTTRNTGNIQKVKANKSALGIYGANVQEYEHNLNNNLYSIRVIKKSRMKGDFQVFL